MGYMDYGKLMELLKKKGWTSYRIRQEQLIGSATLQAIREKKPIGAATIMKLCEALNCQPGDILTYVPDAVEVKADA